MADVVRFTRRETNLVACAVFVVGFGFFAFVINDSPEGVDEPQLGWVVVGIAGMALCAVLAIRAWLMGVYAGRTALTVKNLFRTTTVDVGDIAAIEMDVRPVFGTPIPVVRTRSGQKVTMTALEPPNVWTRPRNTEASTAIEVLRAWHHKAVSASEPPVD